MQYSVLAISLALALVQPPASPLRARLSPVPIDVTLQGTIAGLGAATATLAGTKPGLRGPLVGEFASSGGTTGTFTGTLTLTREQAASFAKGLLYVQVQSEKAPDGNLWGWLMAPKGRR
jgi:hypothetical protein